LILTVLAYRLERASESKSALRAGERCFPSFLHEKVFSFCCYRKIVGISLAESDDYDEIFAALRHPVRRQILFLLEDKGELSFTEIQNTLGLNDTGLISYHLKELATLVEQSKRGKYSLSGRLNWREISQEKLFVESSKKS